MPVWKVSMKDTNITQRHFHTQSYLEWTVFLFVFDGTIVLTGSIPSKIVYKFELSLQRDIANVPQIER